MTKSYRIRTLNDIVARVLDQDTREEFLTDFGHWLESVKEKSVKLNAIADAAEAKTGTRPKINAKLQLTFTPDSKGEHSDDSKIVAIGIPSEVMLGNCGDPQ